MRATSPPWATSSPSPPRRPRRRTRQGPRGGRPVYEHASRAPGARTLDGTARTRFKAAARALEHAPRTARGGGAHAVLDLLLVLTEAIEAATAWHRAQHHRAQTTAAARAAVLLREATTSTPGHTTAPRTVRVTPAPERGPAPPPPVTGVPPRHANGPGPHPGPGAHADRTKETRHHDHLPAPAQLPGEPFPEALFEAAQAAAMPVRLFLTIADAVRRASQKHHHGQEQELGPDAEKLAEGWAAEQLRTVLPEGALHDLMADANWPVMARQLAGLQRAAST
ncbi:hypothetical protein ACFY9Y_26715 [Streptomyces fimicarius]|uniref:hypothetical protein n=1 Tax=Streptomyces griseus TaxID=1911 RepID=UPI0036ED7697